MGSGYIVKSLLESVLKFTKWFRAQSSDMCQNERGRYIIIAYPIAYGHSKSLKMMISFTNLRNSNCQPAHRVTVTINIESFLNSSK